MTFNRDGKQWYLMLHILLEEKWYRLIMSISVFLDAFDVPIALVQPVWYLCRYVSIIFLVLLDKVCISVPWCCAARLIPTLICQHYFHCKESTLNNPINKTISTLQLSKQWSRCALLCASSCLLLFLITLANLMCCFITI
jgi:hypothetical protein